MIVVQSGYDIYIILKNGPHHADGGPFMMMTYLWCQDNLHIIQLKVRRDAQWEEPADHPIDDTEECLVRRTCLSSHYSFTRDILFG